MKKFFKKTEGFTLVELIVVIAILGILAGVGTVGYSGYIKKANMSADQQTIAGVLQAFELASYGTGHTGFGNGVIGYVDISKSGTTATDVTGGNTFMDDAMKAMFGEYSTLALKYGEWKDEGLDNAMAGAQDYLPAVPESTYVQGIGTKNLMGDVQNCTTAFSGFISAMTGGGKAGVETLEKFLGDGTGSFAKELEELGYIKGDDYNKVNKEVLANMTVFGIAGNVAAGAESGTVFQDFGSMYNGGNYKKIDTSIVSRSDALYQVANWYAATEALVAHVDNANVTKKFKDIDLTSNNPTTILDNMNQFSDYLSGEISSNSALKQNVDAYYDTSTGTSKAEMDAAAYVGIMSTVSSLSGEYKNDTSMMNNSSLFTDGAVLNRVNSLVSAAAVGTAPAGSVRVAVMKNSDGTLTCAVSPSNANPQQ